MIDTAIFATDAPVVYFPVRHHSPACARMVRQLIETLRPASVLIEGPSDYNPYLSELLLPHRLPIAIYSFVERTVSTPQNEQGTEKQEKHGETIRSGAYYPFCIYSPEWQAIQTAHSLQIPFAFIDLPWGAMLDASGTLNEETPVSQRYSDGELRHSDYIAALCQRLGVEDFDALWDTLFEIDPTLTPDVYMERAHRLCATIRATDPHIPPIDLQREAHMATRIQQTRTTLSPTAQILVVTGGFHSTALFEQVKAQDKTTNAFEPPLNTLNTLKEMQKTTTEYAEYAERNTERNTEENLNTSNAPTPNAQRPTPNTHEYPQYPRIPNAPTPNALATGISLTPYSYARLDSLTGYEAGMPNPGFYDRVWKAREQKEGSQVRNQASQSGVREGGLRAFVAATSVARQSVARQSVARQNEQTTETTETEPPYRILLGEAVTELRQRKQTVSAADLIAVETMARGLAMFRAHAEVWRTDLIDGIIAALIKDEQETGIVHPFLEAIYTVFRGNERGVLAKGTRLPPLILDIQRLLNEYDLNALHGTSIEPRKLTLDLHSVRDRERSQILHRLRLLSLPGYIQTGGTDFTTRQDLVRLWEEWSLQWSPEFEGGCIESAVYGPTLAEAAVNRIGERAQRAERNAEVVAQALLDAAQIDALPLLTPFHARLIGLIREESDLFRLSRALGHLLYLYRYDEAFGSAGDTEVGLLLSEAFERGMWLLEGLGQVPGREAEQVKAIRALVETGERCADALPDARHTLTEVLERISRDAYHLPLIRGACAGALWTLSAQQMDGLLEQMTSFADATHLGDYLTGLFSLARETAQRQPELVLHLDALLSGYDDEEFLMALPALRLAFSFFTPREKHYLARTLMEARKAASGDTSGEWTPLADITVDTETAARTLALESRLYATLQRYGIRGGQD